MVSTVIHALLRKASSLLLSVFLPSRCRTGKKFAVASSSKQVMICWFDAVNNMWISKAVSKKAKSAVVALAWHPNSQILASASTDYRCRVLCAFLDGVDVSPDAAQFGVLPPFGDQIIDFEVTRSWINDVAWSPSGLQLAFVAHDGLLHVVAFAPDASALPIIKVCDVPLLSNSQFFAFAHIRVQIGIALT